jgi:succinoglycan biosynthesis transport protein ExoP
VQERPINWASRPSAHSARPEPDFDMGSAGRAVRRQLPLVAVCAGIGALIAILMILGSIPRFRAVETVLLDEERSELLEEVSPIPNAIYSNSAIQSEVEIIKSKALARLVVDRLDLHEDEVFMNPPTSLTEQAVGLVGLVTDPIADFLEPEPQVGVGGGPTVAASGADPEPDPEAAARERAAALLRQDLSVDRVGRSFVINIGYEAYSPERARDIARAYGQSYETFQLEASRGVAANAGAWIQQRLASLEERSLDAAAEVRRFRSENGLVQVRGDLLSEQQLSEMASQLIEASADTAQVGARLENLEALSGAPPSEALSLANIRGGDGERTMLPELRGDYLNTRRRYLTVVDEYGVDHPQAVELARTLGSLGTVIDEEIDRALRSVRTEFEIARSREQSLRDDLAAITDVKAEDVAVLGRLAQLEAVAETYQAVYRDYLERFELTTQQEAFPIASVQVISEAELPRGASSPQKKAMLASGLLLGFLVGGTLAAIRELRPRRLRTRDEVGSWLGLPCAGLMPSALFGTRGRDARAERHTALRSLQAIEAAAAGRWPTVAGVASVMGGGASLAIAAAIARAAAREHDSTVLVIDLADHSARQRSKLARRSGVEIAGRERFGMLEDDRADGSPADLVLLAMPALTDMGGVDPISHVCHATILDLPWGRVRPELVDGALSDHQDFQKRLATTVIGDAKIKKARLYMRRGDYEEQIVHA